MAIDLKSINPDIDRSIFKKLLGDKTHFIYELIQNADDSGSTHLGLRLYENELFVWNDGRPFSQEDVQSICSTGSSDKDLTQIGSFGIGFKSVYNYTDFPEIYSSGVCFRIPYLEKPEAIDMDPCIAEMVDENTTVIFRLPFRDSLDPEDVTNLENHLCNLEKERSLLFLRYLNTIQWYDEKNRRAGSYLCHRPDKPQNPSQVELRASIDGENQLSETFLIFHKEVQPQEGVVDRIQNQAEDSKEENRIQRSREELQSIEVAFKLQNGKITTLNSCTLFAYLPTQIKTNLRFLIQARYQTTPSRENIRKPSESPWNGWLVQETAKFIPEILEQLKSGGWLRPAFFNVIPLETDLVPEAFMPISEALQKAIRNSPLVPTEDGEYAKADSVFYPHRESLRGLVESSWLYPNGSWLHSDIRDTEEFRRCFQVMRAAGVREIGIGQVLAWLEKQDLSCWFKDRCEKWLHTLYVYLNSQKSELERIKKLRLVRLENGEHVCASNELVFFPPDTDEEREKIEPFLSNLPILQSTLLEGEEPNEIEAFLKSLGVRTSRPVNLILEGICPQYLKSAKPSVEENCLHVRYLFKVWNDVSESELNRLKGKISEIPILRGYKSQNSVTEFRYLKPGDAYLPQAYTGDDDLETYFSMYDGDVWFIDSAYLKDSSYTKAWFQFLKKMGVMDTPRVIKKKVVVDYMECRKRQILRGYITSTGDETIEDYYLHGLSVVLDKISEHKNIDISRALWCLFVKILSSERNRDSFFQGTYSWRHRSNTSNNSKTFDADFCRRLKEIAWLPDEQGNFHLPSECFAPTSKNCKVLADSVVYLHPDFNIRTEPAKRLAEELMILLEPDAERVLSYLQKLSNSTEVSVAKVESLYRFLQRDEENAQLKGKFKKESLIFTFNPEPRWWRSNEVFWEDESEVFKNDRGYLKTHYPETLKSFFTDLGVLPEASQRDYALGIQEITAREQAEDEKVRERVKKLYECLEARRVSKWEIIYDSRCWLGKKGDEWRFFTRQELVLKDHPHIGELFEGEVPFWAFDSDLSNLARNLKVEGCSQAQVEFHPKGDEKENTNWSEKVRNLRSYIHAFLNSPRLYDHDLHFWGNSPCLCEELEKLSVCQVKELKVTYTLKGTSVTDSNPRQSFLDVTDQQAKLWLGQEANKDEYAELIGDALQDYFGVNELGRLVEDLLTKDQDRVLSNWKRKGLETDLCIPFQNADAEEIEEKQPKPIDEELVTESGDGDSDLVVNAREISTDNEISKINSEDDDSATNEDESDLSLPSNGDSDSVTGEPEIEVLIDSETSEMGKADDDSIDDELETRTDSPSNTGNISSPDTQVSINTKSPVTHLMAKGAENETPMVNETSDIDTGDVNSGKEKSETHTRTPRTSRRKRPSGAQKSVSSGGSGVRDQSNHGDKKKKLHAEEMDASGHDRKEIERIGMEHARGHEEKEGRIVEDVSADNLGFDLRSASPDNKVRCIEVKARAERALVVLTSNEWNTAERLKDDYFLYVVLNAATQPELYIIRNPTDEVTVEKRVDVRYQVPLSEIMEHGKLV